MRDGLAAQCDALRGGSLAGFKNIDSAILGYALFLAMNATAIWGGVFPFLPMEFQTPQVTISFYLAQITAFCSLLFLAMAGSYYRPELVRRALTFTSSIPIFAGSLILIAAMYIDALTMPLVVCGGALLGVGCSGFFLLWQRLFASQESERCNKLIIIGTGTAPLIYFALYLVPGAVTAFLTPLVFVPLCGLALSINVKSIDYDQPMFSDVPREHPNVYTGLLRDSRGDILSIAALGLASGVIRAIALADPAVGDVVNTTSMLGSLIASVALMLLWQKASFHFDVAKAFRFIFPFIATGFVLLPVLDRWFLLAFAAFAYTAFSFSLMLMSVQSAQLARDRGVNPLFAFGLYAGVVYLFQGVGFIAGYLSGGLGLTGLERLSSVGLAAVYIMALILLLQYWSSARALSRLEERRKVEIEFIALSPTKRDAAPLTPKRKPRKPPSAAGSGGGILRDAISKKCLTLQERYLLSDRESEVMELIARGNSVARIAEALSISENTVRSHSKKIYAKLDIHKRQGLLDLLDEIDS